jgi:hypothetical protein
MFRKFFYFLFLLMLYACPKVEEDCLSNATQATSLVCIELYEPVCGCNKITYSNACVAESWGINQFSQGACTN